MSGARETNKRITRAKARTNELTQWLDQLRACRRELLVSLPKPNDTSLAAHRHREAIRQLESGYTEGELCVRDPHLVKGLRAGEPGIAGANDELGRLKDQLEALEATLPSAEAVASAQGRADELVSAAEAQGAEFAEGIAVLLDALTDSAAAARQVGEARDAQQRTLGELERLTAEFDLDSRGPRPVELDADQESLARTLVGLVSGVIDGGTVDPGLASKLRRLRRQEQAA